MATVVVLNSDYQGRTHVFRNNIGGQMAVLLKDGELYVSLEFDESDRRIMDAAQEGIRHLASVLQGAMQEASE